MRVEESVNTDTGTPHEAERWLSIHDDVLRGLAHAISNRLATITAAAGVLDASELPDIRFIEGLHSDADRLDGLLTLMRHLPRRVDAPLEPMLLSDPLDSARRLVEEHPLMRSRSIVVASHSDVAPARAEPGAVLHAMTVALLCASRCGSGTITAALETVGDHVRFTARVDGGREEGGDDMTELDARTVTWLLRSSHGRGSALADGCAFEVPTLQASRRRSS